jgi:hypothetical protein
LWLFQRVAGRMNVMMSETIAGVMAEAFKHPEVQELLRERMDSAPLTQSVQSVVDNAVARGELRPVTLPVRALRLPLDLIRSEAMSCGGPVADDALATMVDDVYLPLLRGLAVE